MQLDSFCVFARARWPLFGTWLLGRAFVAALWAEPPRCSGGGLTVGTLRVLSVLAFWPRLWPRRWCLLLGRASWPRRDSFSLLAAPLWPRRFWAALPGRAIWAATLHCLCGHSPSTHRHFPTVLRIGRHFVFVNLALWLPAPFLCRRLSIPSSCARWLPAGSSSAHDVKPALLGIQLGFPSGLLKPGYLPTWTPTSVMSTPTRVC
jgi:hypothetical protein